MAELNLGTPLDSSLQALLSADVKVGEQPSYQLCKLIYTSHPLGAKIARGPVKLALAQERDVTIAADGAPEEEIRKAFQAEARRLKQKTIVTTALTLARVYGLSATAMVIKGKPAEAPIGDDLFALAKQEISFNVLDPLNISGSAVTSLDPNSMDFQRVGDVSTQGQTYHASRVRTVMHEDPVYIEYTNSAFGYVGRSIYQRSLYPLKSYVQTMITNDMVSKKAGVLVAKVKQTSSIVDGIMAAVTSVKRSIVKAAFTHGVISIDPDEDIISLDLQNVGEAQEKVRSNILEDIAASGDMPAIMLNNETFAEGFGEGTEDAKMVARYIDTVREEAEDIYEFLDLVVMYRAWTPEFYETLKTTHRDYCKGRTFKEAFFEWKNGFSATWPNLLTEPDSEKAKVEDVKLKAALALAEVFVPVLDPINKASLVQFVNDTVNNTKLLFPAPWVFDAEEFENYVPPSPLGMGDGTGDEGAETQQPEPKPFAAAA